MQAEKNEIEHLASNEDDSLYEGSHEIWFRLNGFLFVNFDRWFLYYYTKDGYIPFTGPWSYSGPKWANVVMEYLESAQHNPLNSISSDFDEKHHQRHLERCREVQKQKKAELLASESKRVALGRRREKLNLLWEVPLIAALAGISGYGIYGIIGPELGLFDPNAEYLSTVNVTIRVDEQFHNMDGIIFDYDSNIEDHLTQLVRDISIRNFEILIETRGEGLDANYQGIGNCTTGAKLDGRVVLRDSSRQREEQIAISGYSAPRKVVRETCSGYESDAMDALYEKEVLEPVAAVLSNW